MHLRARGLASIQPSKCSPSSLILSVEGHNVSEEG